MATISPCLKICRYGAGPHCEGCRRTISEISRWSSFTNEEAQVIMDELPDRHIPS
jgi:predicted Fe-S protein YdhL (DUF1289 family)